MLNMTAMRYFVAVVEARSITHAAEKLGIQQPPLSNQMKNLEKDIGVKLLVRVPRGVQPTPAGNVLFEACRKILMDTEKAVAKVRSIDRAFSGKLAIGVTRTTITHPSTREVIAQFIRQYEYVDVSIVTNGSVELIEALTNDEIDIAIARPLDGISSRLRSDLIADESMVAAIPKHGAGSEFDEQPPYRLEMFAHLKAILYGESTGPVLYNKTVQAFALKGIVLDNVQDAPSAQIALDLVSTGLGFTIIPKSLSDTKTDQITYFDLDEPSLSSCICLFTRISETGEMIRAFRQLMLDHSEGATR